MPYAVPSCFSGIIFGTEGHIAEGTNDKATPRSIIIAIASGVDVKKGIE